MLPVDVASTQMLERSMYKVVCLPSDELVCRVTAGSTSMVEHLDTLVCRPLADTKIHTCLPAFGRYKGDRGWSTPPFERGFAQSTPKLSLTNLFQPCWLFIAVSFLTPESGSMYRLYPPRFLFHHLLLPSTAIRLSTACIIGVTWIT